MMRFRPSSSRWSLFLPLLPAAALIPALSGCGGQEKFANTNTAVSGSQADAGVADAQDGAVKEPESKLGKYGGKMTNTSIADPKTLNYWVAAETSSTGAVGQLFEPLITRNSYTLEYEGDLADLPKVSADGLTWTFTLKPGIKWSDGVPVTADDVIFTLDVIYDTSIQTNMREGMMLDKPDGKGGYTRVPLKYKKIDDRTVEFKLPVRYAPARDILSFPIAPSHKLLAAYKAGNFNSTWGVNTNVRDIVGTGPYLLDEYKSGQRLVYKRNPHYWRKDKQGRPLPYLDQIVTLIVPDINTQTLKFLAGESDILGVPATDYKTVKDQEEKGDFTVVNLGPTTSTSFLSLNLNPRSKPALENPELNKLFNDVRFRRALSHAIDREKICRNVFNGLARPGYGPETPANKLFYYAETPKFEYNPDKAKALLTETGLKDTNGDGMLEFPDSKPVRFNILTNVENKLRTGMAEVIQDNFKAVGIDATFTPIAFNTLVQKLDAKPEKGQPYPPYDWESIILGFTGGIEPTGGNNVWRSSGNLHQWEPYQDKPSRPWEAQIDDLFIKGAQEMDEQKRKQIYYDFQKIVGEQQPFIYTVVPDSISALRNKYDNIKPCSLGGQDWNIYEIYETDATRDQP